MTEETTLDDYDLIEQEVGEWAEANFGAEQPDWYPLVGAVEEIGEIASCYAVTKDGRMAALLELIALVGDLSHSILKDAQGIRGDEDGVGKRAEERAIGDIHYTLSRLEDYDSVGAAELRPSCHEEVVDGVGDVNVYLADYNYRNDTPMSLGESVGYAWYGEVQGREWDADVAVEDATFGGSDD